MINLEYEIRNGFVKLNEVGKNRKDRYSSLAYCNYYARELETKLKKKKNAVDPSKLFLFKTPTLM